jgi:hypothetical protein
MSVSASRATCNERGADREVIMNRAQKLLLASAVSVWVVTATPGQQPAPPATPPATTPRATPPATRPPPAAAERDRSPAEAPKADSEGASEEEVIPTEELPPDSAINFPVDI